MLCKSCKHCADGVGGNRRCFLNVDNPLPMGYIRKEERDNCKWYEHDDIPSWQKYAIERCPICGREITAMMLQAGVVGRRCTCGYDSIS